MVRVVGHRYAPVERGAGDGQIAQTAGDEADDLVAPCRRPDELRMGLVVRQQLVLVVRQPEEVGMLLGPVHRGSRRGGGAGAVGGGGGFGVGVIRLVTYRVPARVGVQVDVTVVGHPAPDRLRRLVMIRVGGSDEPVEGDVELALQRLEHVGITPGQLRRRDSRRRRRLRHLQAVFVGTGEVTHVEAVQPLEAGDRVGRDVLVRMADVRLAIGVRDGGGDVERIQ